MQALLTTAPGFLVLGAYIAAARLTRLRPRSFAVVNLSAILLLWSWALQPRIPAALLLGYFLLVAALYLPLRLFAERQDPSAWLAFAAPLLLLVLLKYLPLTLSGRPLLFSFVGVSYLAFRLSYLVLEVRNGVVRRPDLWQYLGFAFFVPTLVVGPISSYALFQRGAHSPSTGWAAPRRCLLRIAVGAGKLFVLGGLLDHVGYARLLALSQGPARWQLLLAVLAYPLYLYANFSGFCDMAIGAAALCGVPLKENFDEPFRARNVKDFWNRWHITLSEYTRDTIFYPVSKALIGWRPRAANHGIAAAILCVFLVIGVWHGAAWHYLAFGAFHAAGVIGNHYYTLYLKRRLGPRGLQRYNRSPLIRGIAVAATFLFVAVSFFLFANDFTQARQLLTTVHA